MLSSTIATMRRRCRLDRQAHRLGHVPRDRLARRADVQHDAAGPELRRVEVAQHQVRVRHRRARPAAPVAGRPRVGAGALRPDPQQAERIDPRDGAATRPDLDQVHRRHRHRRAAAALEPVHPVDLVGARHRHLAARHQASLGRRAAHVEGQDVVDARLRRQRPRRQHAAHGPRLRQPHRHPARDRRGDDPAARLHQEQRPRIAGIGHALLHPAEVLVDPRPHVGVERGRREPLELLHLGQDVGRQREVEWHAASPPPLRPQRARARGWRSCAAGTPRPTGPPPPQAPTAPAARHPGRSARPPSRRGASGPAPRGAGGAARSVRDRSGGCRRCRIGSRAASRGCRGTLRW